MKLFLKFLNFDVNKNEKFFKFQFVPSNKSSYSS